MDPEDFPVDGIEVGPPKQGEDEQQIATLFWQDLADLGLGVTKEQMETLAANVTRMFQDQDNPDFLCWIARPEQTGQPVGIILANKYWSVKFGGRSLWIEELYVDPEFRRRGIGVNLVKLVLSYGRENGFKGIDLEAYQGNTPAAILYRTMGFKRLGRARFYYSFT